MLRRYKQLCAFGVLAVTAVMYQNCGDSFSSRLTGDSDLQSIGGLNGGVNRPPGGSSAPPDTATSVTIFSNTLFPVLRNNCAGCHGATQMPLHSVADAATAHTNIFNSNLVNLMNPSASRFVAKIQGGHQGFPATLAASIQTQIESWATQLTAAGSAPPPAMTTTTTTMPLPAGAGTSVQIFSQTLFPLLRNNCAGCHGVAQAPLHSVADPVVAHTNIFNANLVNLVTPAQSRFVIKIQGGHQGFPVALATQFQTQIQAWSTQLTAAGGTPPPAAVLEPTFQSLFKLIFEPKCTGCHGAMTARSGVRMDSYARVRNALGEDLLEVVADGEMPPGNPLTRDEVAAIREWIADGAPNN